MNVSPPIPWADVPVGATVLDHGTPRQVLGNEPFTPLGFRSMPGSEPRRVLLLEGLDAPLITYADATVPLVLLDDIDAIGALVAAGLTIEPIQGA
jgi:hypothetical protein